MNIAPQKAGLGHAKFVHLRVKSPYSLLEGALTIARLLNPNDSSVLAMLGEVAEAQGKESVALDFYQKAVKANPVDADAADALTALIDKENVRVEPLSQNLFEFPDDVNVFQLFPIDHMPIPFCLLAGGQFM